MKPYLTFAAALCLVGSGCSAVVEERVETGLVEAGVPSCMAAQWTDKLSVAQIREIADLAGQLKAERETLTVGRLLDHVQAWNDPEALRVVSSSAASCALS